MGGWICKIVLYQNVRLDFTFSCRILFKLMINKMKTYNIIKQLPREAFVLHIPLVTFISCAKVHLIYFILQSPAHSLRHSFPSHSSYRSQSFSFTFTISGYTHTASYFNLIVSSFFNQSCLWKQGVSLGKVLIWNTYCIIWSWTPMVLLLLVIS